MAPDDGAQSADQSPEPADAEEQSLRRLAEADALVRSGAASLHNGGVRLLIAPDRDDVVVDVPLPPGPLTPTLTLKVRQPSEDSGDDLVAALTLQLAPHLPGELEAETQEASVSWRWTPQGDVARAEAVERCRALAGHLGALSLGEVETGDVAARVADLSTVLAAHTLRAQRLRQRFSGHALVRLDALGMAHLLAHHTSDDDDEPRLVVMVRDAALLSPETGRGVAVALRWPSCGPSGRLSHLAVALCQVLHERFEARFEPSDELTLLGSWARPEHTALLQGVGRTDLSFDELLWQLVDLARFMGSLDDLVADGLDPFDLLAMADPGPDPLPIDITVPAWLTPSVARDPAPETALEPAQPTPAPPTAGSEPERPEPRPKASQPAAQPPAPPRPATPERRPPQRPKQAPQRPSLDRMSAREVVQKLGMQEQADVDVYLSHPGYNQKKTVDIMTVVLSLSRDDATALVERAPCLVVGPVTRSRAVRVKTILEGTGCTIQIIPTGEKVE